MNLIISDTAALPFQIDANTVLIAPAKQIHPCIGCFSCWVKTPGQCVIKDGFELTGAQLAACTRLLIVSKCVYGSTSPFVKNVIARSILSKQNDSRESLDLLG